MKTAYLRNQPIIFGMRSDPEPINAIRLFHAESPVTDTYPNRPELFVISDHFEVKRWMGGIRFKNAVVLIGKRLDMPWKLAIGFPKTWESEMSHKGFALPEAISESASARIESKRPSSRSLAI